MTAEGQALPGAQAQKEGLNGGEFQGLIQVFQPALVQLALQELQAEGVM